MKSRNQKGMSDVGFMFLSMIGSFGFLIVLMLGGLTFVMRSVTCLTIGL